MDCLTLSVTLVGYVAFVVRSDTGVFSYFNILFVIIDVF